MNIKRLCYLLHLWIGLATGIIVFVVSITGAIYLFKDEISSTCQPWKKVEVRNQPFLQPSKLIEIANTQSHQESPSAITIGEKDEAVWVDYFGEKGQTTIYLNPYDGKIIHTSHLGTDEFDFYRFILNGHLYMWFPRTIGKPLVSYGVLLFFLTLLTGLVIWMPKHMTTHLLKKRLAFHRPFKWSRFVYDLHNVLGIYMLLPIIVVSITGLIFGLDWFSHGIYQLASGGKQMEAYTLPPSDSLHIQSKTASIDLLQAKILKESPNAVQYYYVLPADSLGSYRVSVVHEKGSYYKQDNLFFDQYTLKELKGTGPYAGRYKDGTPADKLIHATLDLHEGIILGWIGKIIMLFAALTSASLPITGFLLWRRKKNQKKPVG